MKELPEVDDEFVKDVSEFDTLADYKEDLKKKLAESKEKEAADDLENQLIDKLVELVQGEIPEAMYENKIADSIPRIRLSSPVPGSEPGYLYEIYRYERGPDEASASVLRRNAR